jgi:hypothetical protein
VNDDQRSARRTHSEEDEPIFFHGVFWIKKQARMWIAENVLSFFKPNSMLCPIAPVFPSSQSKRSRDAKGASSVVEKFRDKYGASDVKKYYSKFDVAVLAQMR